MMTHYYASFPVYKAHKGLVIDLGEKNISQRYIYFPDTCFYRYYIIDNSYFGASYIYVGWLNRWLSKDVFYRYVISNEYEEDKKKAYIRYATLY